MKIDQGLYDLYFPCYSSINVIIPIRLLTCLLLEFEYLAPSSCL